MRLVDMPFTFEGLAVARIVVSGLWLSMLLFADLPGSADLPEEWFDRNGPLLLLPESVAAALRSPASLWTVHLGGCGLAVACLLGVRPFPLVAVPLLVTVLVAESLGPKAFTGGEINHAQLGAVFALAGLAIFPCGERWSICGPARRRLDPHLAKAAMLVPMLLLGAAYMAIGTRRIARNGIDIFLDETILTYFTSRSLIYSPTGFDYGLLVHDSAWLAAAAKAGFAVTTLCEALAPLCLLAGPRLRTVWLVVMVPFHLLSLFTMNIFFWENIVLILTFFTGWPQRFADRLRRPHVAAEAPEPRAGRAAGSRAAA